MLSMPAASFVTVVGLTLAAIPPGWSILRATRLDDDASWPERIAASTLFGLGLFAAIVFLLGTLAWLTPIALFGSFTLVAVVGLALAMRRRTVAAAVGFQPGVLGWVAFAIVLLHVPKAFIPDFAHDDLVYHLALPARYLRDHAMLAQPFGLNDLMPHNLDLLNVPAMAGGDYPAARLLGLVLEMCVVVLLIGGARRLDAARLGGAAALLYLSSPSTEWTFATNYTEGGIGAYVLLALWALLRFRETHATATLLGVGAALGLACGSKYTAMFPVSGIAVTALAVIGSGAAVPGRVRAGQVALLGGTILLLLLPWLVRSYGLTGNPIWPNGNHLFGGRYWSPAMQMQMHHKMSYHGILGRDAKGTLQAALRLPWDLVARPAAVYSWPGWSGTLVLLFLLSPLALLRFRGAGAKMVVASSWIGFVSYAFAPMPNEARYLLPIAPVLALAGLAPLAVMVESLGRPFIANALVAGGFLLQAFLGGPHFIPPFDPAVLTAAGYRAKMESSTFVSVPRAIAKMLPANAKPYFLFENRMLFLGRDYWDDALYDVPACMEILRSTGSARAMADYLKANGITHLVFNPANAHAYFNQSLPTQVTDPVVLPDAQFERERAMFEELLTVQAERMAEIEGMMIFRLK